MVQCGVDPQFAVAGGVPVTVSWRAMQKRSAIRRSGSRAYRNAQRALQARVLGPLTAHRRPGAVAMFHIGRCGSTVLSDLLDQHPKISWDGEPYNRVAIGMDQDGIEPRTSGFDPAAHVHGRFNRVGWRWYLYTLKFNQVTQFSWDMARYLDEIEHYGVNRLIVLGRSNLLHKVVSGLMARESGRFQTSDPGAVQRQAVRIDVEAVEMEGETHSLVGQFDRWTREYEEFDRLIGDRPVLRLNYESDLLADPVVAYEKVLDHLSLEPYRVDVRLQKLNPFALGEVIENLPDVQEALRDTPHSWMLD